MRRRLIAAAVASAALGVPVAHAATPARVSAPVMAQCGAGYESAYLPWGHRCLRAGEFCKVGNRAYLRYGFYCPATGHLRYR